MNKIFKKIEQGLRDAFASSERETTSTVHPLKLVGSYEDSCLAVYDSMCLQDRLATAFALERYRDASDAIHNMSEPQRTELRGLIADRDVVPGSIEVAVRALLADVQSIPPTVLAGAMRAEYGDAANHPASVRRIECALSLIEMAATRRSAAKAPVRAKAHVKAA